MDAGCGSLQDDAGGLNPDPTSTGPLNDRRRTFRRRSGAYLPTGGSPGTVLRSSRRCPIHSGALSRQRPLSQDQSFSTSRGPNPKELRHKSSPGPACSRLAGGDGGRRRPWRNRGHHRPRRRQPGVALGRAMAKHPVAAWLACRNQPHRRTRRIVSRGCLIITRHARTCSAAGRTVRDGQGTAGRAR